MTKDLPSDVSRRDALRLLALSAAAPALLAGCRDDAAQHAAHQAEGRVAGRVLPDPNGEPTFFTPHEVATARRLADDVLPADGRGPAASEVGVVAFIDGVMTDELLGDPVDRQTQMRGGLAWLDTQSRRAFGKPYVEGADAQRYAILDRVAYPDTAAPADAAGVAFFSRFRDYVAAGYFSSPQGIEDLGYRGNTPVAQWTGCPAEVQRYIGSRTA